MKRILLWILVLPLAACATLLEPRPGSLLAAAPVGGTLTLTTPLEVPVTSARVYIQGARTVTYWNLDEYYPYCVLRLSTVSDRARTVAPDTFTITRTFNDTDQAARRGVMVAGLNVGVSGVGVGDGDADHGVVQAYFTTRIFLSSARQPDVVYLDCASKSDYALGDYLTREEFRSAVGDVFRLG